MTLGAAVAAVMARFTRASFVDVLNEDYMRTARAKGVSENGSSQARLAQCDDPGGHDDGAAVRLFARRLDRRGEGLQLARAGRLLVDSVEMRDYPVFRRKSCSSRWSLFLSI
jgi:glutathione transport system permease protein